MITNRGMRHLALRVNDVDRAAEFYARVFGMRLVWQPDPDNAYLSSGCDNLALHRGAPGDASAGALDHLGFIVASVADLEAGWRWAETRAVGYSSSLAPASRRFGVILHSRPGRQRYPAAV